MRVSFSWLRNSCPEKPLREAQQRAGYFTEERAIAICLQILRALADAHRYGLVHRDLKPGNIMLVEDALGEESVKVLDFGVAKAIHENPDEDSSTPTTMTGMMLGTLELYGTRADSQFACGSLDGPLRFGRPAVRNALWTTALPEIQPHGYSQSAPSRRSARAPQ